MPLVTWAISIKKGNFEERQKAYSFFCPVFYSPPPPPSLMFTKAQQSNPRPENNSHLTTTVHFFQSISKVLAPIHLPNWLQNQNEVKVTQVSNFSWEAGQGPTSWRSKWGFIIDWICACLFSFSKRKEERNFFKKPKRLELTVIDTPGPKRNYSK